MDRKQVRRLEVVETGGRCRWSAEAKRRIVEESLAQGATASSVARRHGISPGHLFLWRRAYRSGELTGSWPAFAPVIGLGAGAAPDPASLPSCDGPAKDGRMEVVARGGRRVIVGADVDVAALMRVLEALERT